MQQKIPPKPKYRIRNFEGSMIVLIAVVLWSLMVILSLTGVGEIISEFIAFLGSGLFACWFWIRGAYKDEAGIQNMTIIFGESVVNMFPWINDIPVMVAGVAAVLILTRLEDHKLIQEWEHKNAALKANIIRQQQLQQAAAVAASNAVAVRQQALAESKAALEQQEADRAEEESAEEEYGLE